MIRRSPGSRFVSLFVLVAFVAQLLSPAVLAAAETERFDRRLLSSLAAHVKTLTESVCRKVSEIDDSRLELKTFLCDSRHRIFMDLDGTVTFAAHKAGSPLKKKLREAVDSCLSTNGAIAMDVAVRSYEDLGDGRCRVSFRADLVITLREVIRELFAKAANVLGAVTIGVALSKVTNFFEGIDAEAVGVAIKSATLQLWALGAGKLAADTYDTFDRTGHVSIKQTVVEGFTLRSFLYHFGYFILKAGVAAGATVTRLAFPAALGASMVANVGVFVGAALAVAAIGILGSVVIDKLTLDLPIWASMRRLVKYHAARKAEVPGSTEEASIAERMETTEDGLADWLDKEIPLDRYTVLDKLVGRLGAIAAEGGDEALAPYEGLIRKLVDKLQHSVVQEGNWNASRKYYQLLAALKRLPPAAP